MKTDIVTRYKSYIVCTSPRSGSTLLCKMLAATGKAGNPDSHFHRSELSAWMAYHDLLRKNFASEHCLLSAIFQTARDRGTGNTGIFGLRLQRASADFFIQKLRIVCTSSGSDAGCIQEVFGKTLFIHLIRDNKLNQAISLVKASQTGLWHQAPDGTELERTAAPKAPVFDAGAIARHMRQLAVMDAQWKSWFDEQALEPLRIYYDDLSNNPLGVLAHLLDALGLDKSLADGVALPVARLSNEINEQWKIQFLSDRASRL